MNERDTKAALDFLEGLARKHPDEAVIAFDLAELAKALRNTGVRSGSTIMRVLNDAFSATSVCDRLGTIYTLAEYGEGVYFLIAANKVFSATNLFDPRTKTYPKPTEAPTS